MKSRALDALARAGVSGERDVTSPGAAALPVSGECAVSATSAVCSLAVREWRSRVSELARCEDSDKSANLRRVASAGSALLRECDGRVHKFVAAVGEHFFSPHIHVDAVRNYFGVAKKFPLIDRLLIALKPGVPVDVRPGGNLDEELAYRNHPSVRAHTDRIAEKIISDVVLGRAIVFDIKFVREVLGLRVSPLGVVEEPKFRIIHDLTFASARRSSVNDDTDFTQAPECRLGHVLTDILRRILFLRQLHRTSAEIVMCRIDAKEAFRQLLIDPAGAPAFGYVFGDQVVVDLRCQFGWRSSPGFWSLFSSALEHSHTHTSYQDATVTDEGVAAVQHVKVIPSAAAGPAVPVPPDCLPIVGEGGYAGSRFFVRYYVDDGVLIEVRFFEDGRRCLKAIQSIASDHFRLLGVRGPSDPPLLAKSKLTDFSTRLEVLGWVLDTHELTLTLPERKHDKLRRVLDEWPPSRAVATARQISQLTGFLAHVCLAVRVGRFFVGRLLEAASLPASAVFESGLAEPTRRITLGPMFHDELEDWRWFVEKGLVARGGSLCSPMFNIVARPPTFSILTDASKRAIGGYCPEGGQYFRYDLSEEEQSRFVGSSKYVVGENDISINVLELLGMVVGAWLLIVKQQRAPAGASDRVLLRGDNEASVAWIKRCRGAKEPRSGALMRLLGVIEVSSTWHFDAEHVPGVFNSVADGISRWEPDDVFDKLCSVAPNIAWQVVDLGSEGRAMCSAVLGPSSSGSLLRSRLKTLTWDILDVG